MKEYSVSEIEELRNELGHHLSFGIRNGPPEEAEMMIEQMLQTYIMAGSSAADLKSYRIEETERVERLMASMPIMIREKP